MSYNQGDVVTYGKRWNGEAIVDYTDDRGDIELTAWRSVHDKNWIVMPGRLRLRDQDVKPHPEADRVRAEFTAYVLLNPCDNT